MILLAQRRPDEQVNVRPNLLRTRKMQISLLICEVCCKQRSCRSACSSAKGADQPSHPQSLLQTTKLQISLSISEVCCEQQKYRSAYSPAKSAANNKAETGPDSLVVRASASDAVGRGFATRPRHIVVVVFVVYILPILEHLFAE